ncbi:MAG: RNA polymerase sigma factor [Lachnospiraceae bacterium]|nr:RNA polymerase sigma factor [Lachnospiraceae bacterium]
MKQSSDSNYQSYTQAVTAARNGDPAAFRYLYESTYRDKHYLAQKYMRNETDAQDVLQEAYLKAWQSIGQLQDAEKFPSWMSMIVSSTALNVLKKKKDLPFSALEQTSEDGDAFTLEEEEWRREYQPEHAYTDKETSDLLNGLMDALSDEQRFCVLMYYVEEHSVSEIASLIGCPENTVKSRLNYGRKNLKKKAEEMEQKGYKLYGISIIPLLLWLFRTEAKAAPNAIPPLNTSAAVSASRAGTTGTAATTWTSATGGTGATMTSPTGAGAVNVAAATASAGKAAGISLGVKIVAAVIGVTVLGGGALVASIRATTSIVERVAGTDVTDSTDMVQAENEDTGTEVTSIVDRTEEEFSETESLAEEIAAPLTWDSYDGLYSGSKEGQYYYVWIEMNENGGYSDPDGTIRLLWQGDRPYEEGDALLPDDPHDFYGVVTHGYEIRPAWDGENYSMVNIGDGAYINDFSIPITCFGFQMERDTEFVYDGTTLKKR